MCVCACLYAIIGMMSYLYCAVGTPYSPRADQAICQSIIYLLFTPSWNTLIHPFLQNAMATQQEESPVMGLFLEHEKVHLNPESPLTGVNQWFSNGGSQPKNVIYLCMIIYFDTVLGHHMSF